jgi:hypothetical protein
MKKLLSFLFFLVAVATQSYEQVTTVPVDPLTGRLALTLPITELHSGSINLPIVLVYTAGGGVPVDANEGSAGVGWDVAVSGAVRRELRALPDDYKGTGTDKRMGWLNGSTAASIQTFAPASDDDLATCADERDDFNFVNSLDYNVDPEPDLFSFSAPGLSGQFMFSADGVPRPIPYQDIKITPTKDANGKITAFDITTNTGTIYTFSFGETSSRQATASNGAVNYLTGGYGYYKQILPYISAWDLRSITAPDGGTVEYNYSSIANTKSHRRTAAVVTEAGLLSNQYETVDITNKNELEYLQTKLNVLSFTWADHRISSIELMDNKGGTLGIHYNFTYREYKDKWNTDGDSRAFLITVQQESNCVAYPAYTFYYYGLDDTNKTVTLPFRSSGKTDLWGYCNGTSDSSIPALYVNTNKADGERMRVTPIRSEDPTLSGDRRPTDDSYGAAYLSSGMPSIIQYPTGSTTFIRYESNSYFDAAANKTQLGGGVRVKSVQFESTKTEYYYNTTGNANATDRSSGKLSYPPSYAFVDGTAILRTTTHLGPESYVLYSRAVVRQSGRGKTVYDYLLPAMYPLNTDQDWSATKSRVARSAAGTDPCKAIGNQVNGFYAYPFAPTTNFEFERGLPEFVREYSETGAKVQERAYTYQRLTPGTITIKGLRREPLTNNIVYGLYSIIASTGKVVQTETITRADELNPGPDPVNPTNALESTTTYAYNTKHQLLQSVSVVNSDGVSDVTSFRYAKDFVGLTDPDPAKPEAAGIKLLNITNRHGTLLETQSSRAGVLIGAAVALYKDFGNGKVLPSLKGSYPQGAGFTPLAIALNSISGKQEISFGDKYLSAIQTYSAVGHAMSITDYRKRTSGVRYDNKGELPYAAVTNALAEAIAYDGFEDATPFFTITRTTDGADATNATRSATAVWAGSYGASMLPTTKLVRDELSKGAKRYRISCWVNAAAATTITFRVYKDATTQATQSLTYDTLYLNNWKYLEAIVDMSSGSASFSLEVTSSAAANIDEVRFYPADAAMSTYSYNVLKGRTAEVGERGEAVFTNYDDLSRVTTVLDQNKDIRLLKEYNFSANTNIPALVSGLSPSEHASLYMNTAITFTAPANCLPVGYSWQVNGVTQAAATQTMTYTPTAEGLLVVSVTVSYPSLDPVTTTMTYCVNAAPLSGFIMTVKNLGPGPANPATYSNCWNNKKKFTVSVPKGGCPNGLITYEWSYTVNGKTYKLSGTGTSITFSEELGATYHVSCTARQACNCSHLTITSGKVISYNSNDTNCL